MNLKKIKDKLKPKNEKRLENLIIEDFSIEYEGEESHLLLYGKGIHDSNKLLATPYSAVKLLKNLHPVLDMLKDAGYKQIGRINIEGKWGEPGVGYKRVLEKGHEPFLMNGYQGVEASPKGFRGLELSLYNKENELPNLEENSYNLYLIILNQSMQSIKNSKKRLHKEGKEGWPTSYCWNIQGEQVEEVVVANSSITPSFEDLVKWTQTHAHNGIIKSTKLKGKYRVIKIGDIEKMPKELWHPKSIVEARENSCLINVDHYSQPHIDLHHLGTNYSIGYELKKIERLNKKVIETS